MKLKWDGYKDVYDLYVNGTKMKRIWGKKHALEVAESQSGALFGAVHVEIVNIHTGEIIFNT